MEKMFNVKNRSTSVTGYYIPDTGVRRSFAPGETKRISLEELEKLSYIPGGQAILTQFLQIQGNDIPMKNVEPEYYMSETDVKNLLESGSYEAFLDALDFAPVGVIDLIKKYSVELPLYDIKKREALKAKTGFDVEKAFQHAREELEDENGNVIDTNKATERRVKADSVPEGRRTSGNKYKTVTILDKETTEE